MVVNEEIHIPDSELEFSFVRSSGPGGQAVNKVNSKAVLRWRFAESTALPEGARARFLERFGGRLTQAGDLLLTSDRFRDQRQNQDDCLEKLRAMLLLIARPPKPRKKTRPGRGARERAKRNKRRHSDKKKSRGRGSWD